MRIFVVFLAFALAALASCAESRNVIDPKSTKMLKAEMKELEKGNMPAQTLTNSRVARAADPNSENLKSMLDQLKKGKVPTQIFAISRIARAAVDAPKRPAFVQQMLNMKL